MKIAYLAIFLFAVNAFALECEFDSLSERPVSGRLSKGTRQILSQTRANRLQTDDVESFWQNWLKDHENLNGQEFQRALIELSRDSAIDRNDLTILRDLLGNRAIGPSTIDQMYQHTRERLGTTVANNIFSQPWGFSRWRWSEDGMLLPPVAKQIQVQIDFLVERGNNYREALSSALRDYPGVTADELVALVSSALYHRPNKAWRNDNGGRATPGYGLNYNLDVYEDVLRKHELEPFHVVSIYQAVAHNPNNLIAWGQWFRSSHSDWDQGVRGYLATPLRNKLLTRKWGKGELSVLDVESPAAGELPAPSKNPLLVEKTPSNTSGSTPVVASHEAPVTQTAVQEIVADIKNESQAGNAAPTEEGVTFSKEQARRLAFHLKEIAKILEGEESQTHPTGEN